MAGSERRRAFTRAPVTAPVPVERPGIRPVSGPLRGATPPPSARPARARESLPHSSGAIEPFSPGVAVRGSGAGAGAGRVGRGHVRICCKGTPSRDRRREEARDINDSLRAPRRDRGLCNRFGQPAPPRSPRGAPRVGRRPRRAPPDAERCTSHSKVQFQPSFSRAKCTSRVRSAPLGVRALGASAHEHVT